MEVWQDNEGDHLELEQRTDGTWYGRGNSFDFDRNTYEEAKQQLIDWGYRLIGHE